jgi:hypothetical protein
MPVPGAKFAGCKAQAMRRKLLAAAGVAVLVVALYAAAGYWLAPGYVREALADAARERGLALEVTAVRTKPFALRVELEEIALRGPGRQSFATAASASAELAWASLWRRGWIVEELRLRSPDLALGALPPLEAGGGEGGRGVALTIQALIVENGTLRYAPRDLVIEALTLRARGLSTLDAAAGTYEAAARLADGAGQLGSRGAVALAPFAAEGSLSVAALRAARLLPQAAGQLEGEARYAYRDGAFALHEVSIAGSGLAYAGIELPHATLKAKKLPIPPSQPFEAAAQASVAPQATIAAQGRVGFAPLELQLNVTAENLPLAEAQRWLPQGVALRIVSGALSGTGLIDVSGSAVSYDGSARVGGLRVEERDSGALLLAWKEAETAALRFDSSPLAIEAGEIVARAPEGRLVIEQDGTVNFAGVFRGAGDDAGGEPPRVSFERLRVEAGTLHFADRSLATPFEATIGELSGAVAGFSTAASDAAQVRLNGRVQPYGTARIRGSINLNAPTALADIRAVFRNLQLEAFNPYVAKFAGYRIESGRLSAELRYEVREGRLAGSNQLVFQNMQLGEKLEQKGLLDLPLELAVALLADSQGRIDLAIPVRGDLNDPQFDMGAIVARALGNVVKKIVSAPFRAFARLFGGDGDEDPGAIAFAPGSAALSPPAQESVARVAQGLAERPQLGVEVQGGYDPARDREALRLRAARREVASAAGVQGPLDISDRKVVRAAEKLYLERAGERAALEALRKSEAEYGRVLLQRLAAALPVDEDAGQALARERAEIVRAALVEHGVEPTRVGVGTISGEAQPAATLALRPAAEIAAAGTGATATRATTAVVQDPVRAAQQKLNAVGYDAGPVDGIFGPRTKRALIVYQANQGLELTGELDAATRARLLPLK